MEIQVNSTWKDVYGNLIRVVDILSTSSQREKRVVKEVYYCMYYSYLGAVQAIVDKGFFTNCIQTNPELEQQRANLERILNES